MRRLALLLVLAACSSTESTPGDEPIAPLPERDGGGGQGEGGASCVQPRGICNAECVDLATDARHCGACGHSCLGAPCNVGRCEAAVLASGIDTPTAIRIQGQNAYVLHKGSVDRLPLSGGTPVKLFSAAVPFDVTNGPYALAVDTSYAYFFLLEAGTRYVTRCALGGCFASPDTMVPVGVLNGAAIDADVTSIAWAGTYQEIRQCGTASCTAVTNLVPSQEGKTQLVLLPNEVVWANEFNIAVYRCPRVGCVQPTELVGANVLAGPPGPLQVFGGDAYFAVQGPSQSYAIYTCAVAGCGGAPTLVAQGPGSAGAIAADASGVYWTIKGSVTAPTGSVLACVGKKQCGMFPTVLAAGRASPLGIATTAEAVYWTENGAVAWVAKSLD